MATQTASAICNLLPQNITLPTLQKTFVNFFFEFTWEFCIEKWRGFWWFFSGPGLCFPQKDWEKLNRGVSKPGGFPLFSGAVQSVSRTLSGLFLVGALNGPRQRKRTNRENPRSIPEQIGKIPEKSGKSKKGQKRKDKFRSGNTPPPFETPLFSGPWFSKTN